MTLELITRAVGVVLVLAFPVWSSRKLLKSARDRGWRRPGWFGRAAGICGYVAVLAWLWGVTRDGLDIDETCRVVHGQEYDRSYHEAHLADYFRPFPLSLKCNAGYDLVPGWVNPVVAVFSVLFLLCFVGLVVAGARTISARRSARGPADMERQP